MDTIWISTPSFTCVVWVSDGKIVDAAPILRKFIGQGIDNLYKWITNKFGKDNVRWEKMAG